MLIEEVRSEVQPIPSTCSFEHFSRRGGGGCIKVICLNENIVLLWAMQKWTMQNVANSKYRQAPHSRGFWTEQTTHHKMGSS